VWERTARAIRSIGPVDKSRPAVAEPAPWWDPDAEAGIDPWSEHVQVGGVDVSAGTPVVLRPGQRRADAHDMFLAGMAATVAGVFRDSEGETHLAVTVDDDPATEELAWQGRYLFFRPDEIEPVGDEGSGREVLVAASATSSSATTGSASRSPTGWPPSLPEGAPRRCRIRDHLAWSCSGYDTRRVVDAVPLGGLASCPHRGRHGRRRGRRRGIDARDDPAVVRRQHFSGHVDRVLVVGCQPGVAGHRANARRRRGRRRRRRVPSRTHLWEEADEHRFRILLAMVAGLIMPPS
jgi:hypothetical protein